MTAGLDAHPEKRPTGTKSPGADTHRIDETKRAPAQDHVIKSDDHPKRRLPQPEQKPPSKSPEKPAPKPLGGDRKK
ncbi:hypothetical protein FV227_14895 [Methylobacterium sp. WL119]|nr:hypothetical protein FV227_14895 [Methylobacterium sp. WL119]